MMPESEDLPAYNAQKAFPVLKGCIIHFQWCCLLYPFCGAAFFVHGQNGDRCTCSHETRAVRIDVYSKQVFEWQIGSLYTDAGKHSVCTGELERGKGAWIQKLQSKSCRYRTF